MSLLTTAVLGAILALALRCFTTVPRRTLLWSGGILFLVLQGDFWIAPWRSPLQTAALDGSGILAWAFVTNVIYERRAPLLRFIRRR
jgi:hypothetical protein